MSSPATPPPPEFTKHDWAPYVSVILIALANILCYCCNDNSIVGRWLWKRRGKSLFFAANTAGGGWGFKCKAKPERFWAFDVLEAKALVSSHFLGAWGLLVVHGLTLCWLMVTMLVEEFADDGVEESWLTWFTHWSLVLLSASGGLGLLVQGRYMWRRSRGSQVSPEPSMVEAAKSQLVPEPKVASDTFGGGGISGGGISGGGIGSGGVGGLGGAGVAAHLGIDGVENGKGKQQEAAVAAAAAANEEDPIRWDFLTVAYCLSMETAVTAALFLDLYYWIVLVGVQDDSGFVASMPANYLKHAGNLGIALMQVMFTRLPMAGAHIQALIAYGSAYMVLLWAYGSTTGHWRYGLNWYKTGSVAMFAAVPIVLCVLYVVWWMVAIFRESLGHRLVARRQAQHRRFQSTLRDQHASSAEAV